MRPDTEASLDIPNEVGVELGDAEVVDPLPLTRILHSFHRNPTTHLRPDCIARLHLIQRRPTLVLHEERIDK